ncbi:uncharacterized protein DUF2726 [Grimontella sp. AG753]|nr:uncharacterized protein DUF2726 [Grimontella sp. AG753]
MTDTQINYIGFAVLGLLFWYVQIYRPRKALINPRELLTKKVMNRDDYDMYQALRLVFPAPFILVRNVSLDELLYSPEMNKKSYFHKAMRQQNVAWLVLNEQLVPILAVDYSSVNQDDMKLRYLSHAGVGCCIFKTGTTVSQMQTELQEAADSLHELYSDAAQPENSADTELTNQQHI